MDYYIEHYDQAKCLTHLNENLQGIIILNERQYLESKPYSTQFVDHELESKVQQCYLSHYQLLANCLI
jgi:hypothetical protein